MYWLKLNVERVGGVKFVCAYMFANVCAHGQMSLYITGIFHLGCPKNLWLIQLSAPLKYVIMRSLFMFAENSSCSRISVAISLWILRVNIFPVKNFWLVFLAFPYWQTWSFTTVQKIKNKNFFKKTYTVIQQGYIRSKVTEKKCMYVIKKIQ